MSEEQHAHRTASGIRGFDILYKGVVRLALAVIMEKRQASELISICYQGSSKNETGNKDLSADQALDKC